MKTLIFDMYGVIIKEHHGNFKNFLTKRMPVADFSVYNPNYLLASQGDMPYIDFMRLFCFADAEAAGNDYVENFLTYDSDFSDFAECCVKRHVNIVLLSNDISEWSRHIREYYDIEKYFNVCVVSSQVGIRKPDEAIFRLTQSSLDNPPNDCVYIDDNPDNIVVAKKLGWNTVLFRRDDGYDGSAVKSFGELKDILFCNEVRQIDSDEFPDCLNVIHISFSSVAAEFGITQENCPSHTSFKPLECLQTEMEQGWYMFGLYDNGVQIGYYALSDEGDGAFELHNLAVLHEYRHNGYGKSLLDHAKEKVCELGGIKIKIGIIEEGIVLKEWYMKNGFIHTGTRKFDHLPFTVGFLEWHKL